MPEADLGHLAEDIQKHGQREPGVLYEGMVLDGWHRYLACQRAGRKFLCGDYAGDDPVAFVLSKNLHRRHLTASQRAAAIVAATNWRQRGQNVKSAPGAGLTEKQMAEAAEVSERTIRQAKTAHEAGLGDAVREGAVSAKAAADVAKLPPKQREKAVKAIKEGKPPKEKKPKVIVAERKFEKLYEAVKEELAETREKLAEVAETARELEDKLTMYEATEPDEQQKLIASLQKLVQRKDGEIARQRGVISDLNNKCNALIRQVKSMQRKAA